jgi:hypothetical protein
VFIEHEGNRLGGVDIEIDVAESTHVKAWLRAAVGSLDIESRHTGG